MSDDYAEDYTKVNFGFNTHDLNSVPTSLLGTPSLAVYKGDSTTESTAGITLTVDFDGKVGRNNVKIDLSSDAFYETGEDYTVQIAAGTVDGATVVGDIVKSFSIENRYTRGTESAALANVCTEARLAELDAANIPADLDAVLVDTGTTLPALIDDLAVKKNTAFSNFEFLMVLTADHVTPATGLTVTGKRSIDGAAFAGVAGTIAEVGNGIYKFDALAADTNGDVITWRFSSVTADDTFVTFKTVA